MGANVFVYDYEKFTPADLLVIFEKYRVTSFCAPPTVFRFLIREDLSKFDLSALKYCTIAGEALNPSVYEKWKELTGIKMFEAFGQTETTITGGTNIITITSATIACIFHCFIKSFIKLNKLF